MNSCFIMFRMRIRSDHRRILSLSSHQRAARSKSGKTWCPSRLPQDHSVLVAKGGWRISHGCRQLDQKGQRFLDATDPEHPTGPHGWVYYDCGPRLHKFLKIVSSILSEYHAFSIGEMPCCYDGEAILKAVQYDRQGLSMVLPFERYVLLAYIWSLRLYSWLWCWRFVQRRHRPWSKGQIHPRALAAWWIETYCFQIANLRDCE